MKVFLKTSALLAIIVIFSCEGKEWIVNCVDCQTNEPYNATIKIKLRETGNPVTINIYEGDIEDDILYASYITNGSDYSLQTGLNRKYTFAATYSIEGKTYIAVNSTIPRVKYEESECEDPCYFIYDNIVDLRLKYTVNNK